MTQNPFTSKKILITGGARSGKSDYALNLANRYPVKKLFVATAQSLDAEMANRIQKHREARGPDWQTFEEPFYLSKVIGQCGGQYDLILVDCLTLWVSNLLIRDGEDAVKRELHTLMEQIQHPPVCHLIFVTNEVGLGIVPDNALARQYRDLLGEVNQRVARRCDEVLFMACGLSLQLKPTPSQMV